MVAHKALKTPTAVADFLNNHLAEEELRVVEVLRKLKKPFITGLKAKKALEYLLKDMKASVTWTVRKHLHDMELLEQRITGNNPLTLLKDIPSRCSGEGFVGCRASGARS